MPNFFLNHRAASRCAFWLNALVFAALMVLFVPALFGVAILGETLADRAVFLAFPLLMVNQLTFVLGAREGVFIDTPAGLPRRNSAWQLIRGLLNAAASTKGLSIAYLAILFGLMWGVPAAVFLHLPLGVLEHADGRWFYNNHGEIAEVASPDVQSAIAAETRFMVGVFSLFVWIGVGVFYFLGWGKIPAVVQQRATR